MVLCMFVNIATTECKYSESDVLNIYTYVYYCMELDFRGSILCLTFFANVCAVLLYFVMFDLHTFSTSL